MTVKTLRRRMPKVMTAGERRTIEWRIAIFVISVVCAAFLLAMGTKP